jgi:hypothetical protein
MNQIIVFVFRHIASFSFHVSFTQKSIFYVHLLLQHIIRPTHGNRNI